MNDEKKIPPRRERAPAAPPLPSRRVNSAALLGGASELVIEHSGQEYRLRRTRQGKLILIK
jgi:hemin uptake protein HemP